MQFRFFFKTILVSISFARLKRGVWKTRKSGIRKRNRNPESGTGTGTGTGIRNPEQMNDSSWEV